MDLESISNSGSGENSEQKVSSVVKKRSVDVHHLLSRSGILLWVSSVIIIVLLGIISYLLIRCKSCEHGCKESNVSVHQQDESKDES